MIEENKTIINNEYDYSNCLPTVEGVTYLVQYLTNVYEDFKALLVSDEENNKQLKAEYKVWKYKKNYKERINIYINYNNYNSVTCKDFSSFKSVVDNDNLNNVKKISINLDLDYDRGTGENLEDCENHFTIVFEPYNIFFVRKSNNNENDINQIEANIKMILEKFPVVNTIFCTK